jgi:hypothetical protein
MEISRFAICGLIIKICGFAIAERAQEFVDLRFAVFVSAVGERQ